MSEDEKETGEVKWFNDQKGYGFISRENGEGDVFAHYRSIDENDPKQSHRKTLAQGQRVSFVVKKGPKGLQAESITLI